MEKYTFTEQELIELFRIAREGSYYVDYSQGPLPIAGKDYEYTISELIEKIKKNKNNGVDKNL